MSFLLRACLAIGLLSYLAAHRDDPDLAARLSAPSLGDTASVAWEALPRDARETALSQGADGLIRQMAGSVAGASRDTLAETDRRPAWRGVADR
ncbi:hypothetical protein FPV16_06095 [Methylobacterium sp. W2]|uniref:hypothetical protein n=1 Tax=Methylobacterium sp. W2 TaxID=2598107 RepID=UPI001D0CBF94|nr:hypothetical protein [Methylobacterium sp. W2]MCC0805796.1 hypothetical protein [Methylobacterium sp. W2]